MEDLFLQGVEARLATNGKYYLLKEYYGGAIKTKAGYVSGEVVLASPAKVVNFIDLEFDSEEDIDNYINNPDYTINSNNTRHLFYRLKDELAHLNPVYSKGRIYVCGYKICYNKLGYEIYDRYSKQAINEQEDNSDYFSSDVVIGYIDRPIDAERLEALQERNTRTSNIVLLRSYADYKKYIAGKTKDDHTITIQKGTTKQSPDDKFMDDARDYLDGFLEVKKLTIRFKKRTKQYGDAGKRLLKFLLLTENVSLGKIDRKTYLTDLESLL